MKTKKTILVTLLILVVMLFSGCSKFNIEISELITPPDPTGELNEIRQALFEYAGEDITLRYPKSGDFRSAFIIEDIDGDGTEDALAFYSTLSEESTTVMHVNLITKLEGEWVSVSDNAVESSAIESVEFIELSNDKIPEILVRWKISSRPTDMLSVFGFSNGGLTLEIQQECSYYIACDISGSEVPEFVIISSDSVAKKATANIYRFEKYDVTNLATCPLDVEITELYSTQVSKLANGLPALYIDAAKSTLGTITDVIYLDESGSFKNLFIDEDGTQNIETLRVSNALSYDIDSDEIPEIPLLKQLPSIRGTSQNDIVYLTEWHKCDENGLNYLRSNYMNHNDGYAFSIDEDWKDVLTIAKSDDSTERVFYEYSEDMALATHELFRIKVVKSEDYDKSDEAYSDYFEIAQNDSSVYLGKINPLNEWEITEQTVLNRFDFIKQ